MQDSRQRFSNRVEDYVKYRPGYPEAIIGFLQNEYGLSDNKLIADIGAGTGISSNLFLQAGYKVIAIEPNREMRDKSLELLSTHKRFCAMDGSAEHTGLQDNYIDAIIAGQAFHWFNVSKTKIEFTRILKDGGIVALIWNERKIESEFEKEYDALILRHARDYVKAEHRNIGMDKIAAFFAPHTCRLEVFKNSQSFDLEGLNGRLVSSSYMPARTEPAYNIMLADLANLYRLHQSDGHVTIHYDTKVYVGQMK